MTTISYEAAEAEMAKLMTQHYSLLDRLNKFYNNELDEDITDYVTFELNIINSLENIAISLDAYGSNLATMPEFRDILVCWHIEVSGDAELSVDSFSDMAKGESSLEETIGRCGGMLAVQVLKLIDSMKLTRASSAITNGIWKLSYACNEHMSRELCDQLYAKFGKAISSGLVKLKKRFSGYRLPSLVTEEDLQKYHEKVD